MPLHSFAPHSVYNTVQYTLCLLVAYMNLIRGQKNLLNSCYYCFQKISDVSPWDMLGAHVASV